MTEADWTIVGQGSVALEVSAEHTEDRDDWRQYKVTATPANGWTFDHFEWDLRVRVVSPSGSTSDTVYDNRKTENPYDDASGYSIDLADGTWYPYKYIDEWYELSVENAKAVFVTERHGIIYSPSNRRIVYDPTSVKIMYYP